MRNIHELIGILEGISYDRVINETETIHLQEWLDKNRNLTYDSNQSKIISLVDSVLEDNIITEEEQKQLLACIEAYTSDKDDATRYVYELYGIIDGVICDGVVNDDEIYNLKQWITDNGELLGGYKDCKKIITKIEEIIEDGIVSLEEQQDILALLKDIVNESKLTAKIDRLCTLVREHKSIGLELIDILDDVRAIDLIHQEAQRQLKIAIVTDSRMKMDKKEMVFISLCLIGMLHYFNGNFYDGVRKTYTSLYSQFKEQKVEGMIRSILSRYRDEVSNSTSEERQINFVLYNAIVPAHYLSAFFAFIYDIYKLNFNYGLPERIYEEFEFVYDGLRSVMFSEGDDVTLNIKNTKKIYKLIKTTKQLIVGEGLDAVINLSIIVAKLINKYYWGESIKIFNPYLKAGFEGWTTNIGTRSEHKKRTTQTELRSRWEPSFRLENNKVYLIPPVHKVKSQYDPMQLSLCLYCDGELIYRSEKPVIKEIFGGYQVEPKKIELIDPLGKLTYTLETGKETIYKSANKLYRDFIVFGDEGQEMKNNSDYGGTAVICCSDENSLGDPYFSADSYCLYARTVKCGDTIMIGDTAFSFASIIKPGIIGTAIPHQFLKQVGQDDLIKVYSSVSSLIFESDRDKAKYQIVINNRTYPLEAFALNKTINQSKVKYVVDLNTKNIGINEISVYELFDESRKQIAHFSFCYDPEFELEKQQLDKYRYRMVIKTSLCEKNYVLTVDPHSYDDAFLMLELNENQYHYLLPYDIGVYRIKGQQWHSVQDSLWIGDISADSVIELYCAEIDAFEVRSDDGTLLQDAVVLKNCNTHYEIAAGFLLSYKQSAKFVSIVFLRNEKRIGSLFCYNKCVYDDKQSYIEFNCADGACCIYPVYHGKGRVEMDIKDKKGTVVFVKKNVISSCNINVIDLHSFVDYEVSFYEKSGGLLGSNRKLIWSKEYRFVALNDFPDRYFRIDSVAYDSVINNKLVRKRQSFDRVYVKFLKRNSDGTFIGDIVATTLNGVYWLYQVNPVEIEICSDNINGKMELAITKDGDGLFYDSIHNSVLNSVDSRTEPDIYSYTIDLNGAKYI